MSEDITLNINLHSPEYYPHGFEVGICKAALFLFNDNFAGKYSFYVGEYFISVSIGYIVLSKNQKVCQDDHAPMLFQYDMDTAPKTFSNICTYRVFFSHFEYRFKYFGVYDNLINLLNFLNTDEHFNYTDPRSFRLYHLHSVFTSY